MIDRGDPVILGEGSSAGAIGGLTVTNRGEFISSAILLTC